MSIFQVGGGRIVVNRLYFIEQVGGVQIVVYH